MTFGLTFRWPLEGSAWSVFSTPFYPRYKSINLFAFSDTHGLHNALHIPAVNGNMLRKGLSEFINYYNNRRTHQSLDRKTPFDWYEYAA